MHHHLQKYLNHRPREECLTNNTLKFENLVRLLLKELILNLKNFFTKGYLQRGFTSWLIVSICTHLAYKSKFSAVILKFFKSTLMFVAKRCLSFLLLTSERRPPSPGWICEAGGLYSTISLHTARWGVVVASEVCKIGAIFLIVLQQILRKFGMYVLLLRVKILSIIYILLIFVVLQR
jgi:hypothetical protein